MFDKNYYCLVAGLREYSLDADTKGFTPGRSSRRFSKGFPPATHVACACFTVTTTARTWLISARDARRTTRWATSRGKRSRSRPRTPTGFRRVWRPWSVPISAIVDEDADNEDGIDTDRSFENALFSAYYDECAHSKSRFLRQWADFDRNLRNISAAVVARVTGRSAEQSVVGGDETSQQLKRSSAADFGLRGDVPYLEAVIAAVNDETNLVEKERKIDAIRWNQAEELSTFDYFDINALLAYLVKVNIVARWTRLDDKQGREMLHRLMTSLDGKDLINKQ